MDDQRQPLRKGSCDCRQPARGEKVIDGREREAGFVVGQNGQREQPLLNGLDHPARLELRELIQLCQVLMEEIAEIIDGVAKERNIDLGDGSPINLLSGGEEDEGDLLFGLRSIKQQVQKQHEVVKRQNRFEVFHEKHQLMTPLRLACHFRSLKIEIIEISQDETQSPLYILKGSASLKIEGLAQVLTSVE